MNILKVPCKECITRAICNEICEDQYLYHEKLKRKVKLLSIIAYLVLASIYVCTFTTYYQDFAQRNMVLLVIFNMIICIGLNILVLKNEAMVKRILSKYPKKSVDKWYNPMNDRIKRRGNKKVITYTDHLDY